MSIQGQKPNILLIIGDDAGEDVVNPTGSGTSRAMRVLTTYAGEFFLGALPNISRLLRNGLYFSQAWAQPACSTTRASIFTGWHPWKNGVGSPPGELVYKSGLKTLPQLLPDSYVSGLFGKWHLGSGSGMRPTDHYWDKHAGTLDGVFLGAYNYSNWNFQDSVKGYKAANTKDYATWREVKEAAAWINLQDPATPWFATIAFHSPHSPFHIPPDGYTAPTVLGMGSMSSVGLESDDYKFNLMAQNMDYNIGRLLGMSGVKGDALYFDGISQDRLANTIIIFIGDNGSDEGVALAEAKNNIYEGSIRVPMIIADGQAVVKEFKGQSITSRHLYASRLNATCGLMAHVVDLYKTIVHLVNPDENEFSENTDSVSFRDVVADHLFALNASTAQKRTVNFSQYYKYATELDPDDIQLATIRNANYKLNYDKDASPKYALYKYSGGEIPGREDGTSAENLFVKAMNGTDADAATNLNSLHKTLVGNYKQDESFAFPKLEL